MTALPSVVHQVVDESKNVSFSLHQTPSSSNTALPSQARMYLKYSDVESKHVPTVRKRYSDLHNLLRQLSTKLTELSGSVDQEFLSSYRVHMLSIQMEIKNLKLEVEKGEAALKSDGTVAKLEAEVKWFVDECDRLKVHCSSMENDCKQLTDRLSALREQKLFLSDQLKSIMKRNRVLQAEIGYATKLTMKGEILNVSNGGSVHRKSIDVLNKSVTSSEVDERNKSKSFHSHPSQRSLQRTNPMPSSKNTMNISSSTPNLSLSTPGPLPATQMAGGAGRMLLSRNASTPSMRASRSAKKLEKIDDIMKDKQELENFLRSKSKYEYQLERTVLDIFREIKDRKNVALKECFTKRYNDNERTIDESGFDPNYDPYLTHNPVIYSTGGISGLGLDQFSDNDRFSAVVKYLINFDAFKEVVLNLKANS